MSKESSGYEVGSADNSWDSLSWEILLGMRAQSMGRDQNMLVYKMRELPPEFVKAYMTTNFVLDIGKEECIVRVKDPVPKSLTKFLESRRAETWSIISACNPYPRKLSDDENQCRCSLLQQLLTASNHKFYPAFCRSAAGDLEEPGLLVLDLSHDMARSLGTVFEQNAVIFGERGAVVEVIFCDR